MAQNRQRLSKMLQFQGYTACCEALALLEDHYSSSNDYESIADFISKLNRTITFQIKAQSSVIDPDLAYQAIKILCNSDDRSKDGLQPNELLDNLNSDTNANADLPPSNLVIKLKNVGYRRGPPNADQKLAATLGQIEQANEFNIHYNFLYRRLNALPIFKENFQLMKLETLTSSTQPSIRCICFGLLVKDLAKIDGYLLIDNTGRVPVRITPDTKFRNRLAYTNCIVLVEGVYVNPDDVLFAANVGLPPGLLEPIKDKTLACQEEQMIVLIKEIYLDDEHVRKSIDTLFRGYNSMDSPPALFILIGDFTRYPCKSEREFRGYMKKLIRIIKSCEALRGCHFVFIPGPRDTCINIDGEFKENHSMPKAPLTDEQVPIDLLHDSGFENCHLATNPVHIYLDRNRHISVVSHSYLKQLKKNLIHDLSDRNEEFFETAKQIILSNAHLAAGISKTYHSSMNLWHKPDLLVLADTEAFGNKYDYNSSKSDDTSFVTVPSFSRQFNQFKVYYVRSGDIDDSQVSADALSETQINEDDDDDRDSNSSDHNQDVESRQEH